MKRWLIVLFCTFIFLFSTFTIAKTDTYAKIEKTNENELIEDKKYNTIKNDNTENSENNENNNTESVETEEQEIIEEIKEETETNSSTYVQTSTTEEYVQESPAEETNYVTYGTFGRLYVSGFNVALYDYNVYTNSSLDLQTIVNNDDSAAYYRNKGKLVIADHNYQGFSILSSLSEGTTSYIEFEDGSTISYRLIQRSKGYNTGPDLIDTEGNSFFNMESDIIMYTCYDDGIMVTLWVLA